MFKRSLLIIAIAAALIAPALMLSGTETALAKAPVTPPANTQEQPVIAAMFYSNWCGSCQILDPRIEAVKPDFSNTSVDFVKFDFSFALVRGKALQKLAEEKQIANIYAQNKGRTGFMLLIDPSTEAVLEVITIRDSEEAIAAKLERSLFRPVGEEAIQAG